MNKQSLLESIKSYRPNDIKIDGKITKIDLIKGIFEEQMGKKIDIPQTSATKDMMELHDETQEGLGDINREEKSTLDIKISNKDSEEKKDKDKKSTEKSDKEKRKEKKDKEKKTDKPSKHKPNEMPEKDEPSGDRIQKTGLRFATDLGFKAVALNDEFKKMNSPKEIALKSMFSSDEIKKILKSNKSSWNTATPKQFYCREKNLSLGDDASTTIPCWRTEEKDKIRMANQITKGVLTSYYTRKDEDGEKRFKHPKSGEVWVPMGPRSDEIKFNYLILNPKKNVVAFTLPNNEDDVFIAPMTTKKLDFLFDTNKSSPNKKPSSNQTKNDKYDEDSEKRAGEMLLDIK